MEDFKLVDLLKSNINQKCQETEPIENFLLRQLDIDYSDFTTERKQLIMKNYTYLTSIIIKDFNEIDDRIEYCKLEYKTLENNKTNEAEYRRRKLEYFIRINNEAKNDIILFLHRKIKDYLLDISYDLLMREETSDKLSLIFFRGRYKYAELHDFYDINFDFSTYVKASYFPDVELKDRLKTIQMLMTQRKENPIEFARQIKDFVDYKKLVQNLLTRIEHNFYLCKRKDLFKSLVSLFDDKNYQAFVALGLLELEGMFYDYCLVKFGEKDNMGNLVEKVNKSFNDNIKKLMLFSPYFVFDVPVLRNEIAHKGMITTDNIEDTAYNLVLDLNSVVRMLEEETTDKFKLFFMIFEELTKLDSSDPNYIKNLNKKLLFELLSTKFLIQNYFWQLLKEPEKYKDELLFYAKDNLPEGFVDITTVVPSIAGLLKKEEFWQIIKIEIEELTENNDTIPKDLYELALKLKNDYISILDGNAKKYCIELSSLLKEN